MNHPKIHIPFPFRIVAIIIIALFLQASIAYFIVRNIAQGYIANNTDNLAERVEKDLRYTDGKWDTSLYNSDPEAPNPNGPASGFGNSLYIINSNGVMMDRANPIHGFFDSSDLTQLLKYEVPQYLIVAQNGKWRIKTKPLYYNDKIQGAIAVYYRSSGESLVPDDLDSKMSKNIDLIQSYLDIDDKGIRTDRLDIRYASNDYSVSIVDKYNQTLFISGRTPSPIDISYFAQAAALPNNVIIADGKTNEQFYISTRKILNENKDIVGVVMIGQSLELLQILSHQYLLWSTIFLVMILAISSVCLYFVFGREIRTIIRLGFPTKIKDQPKIISFNKQSSIITIDDMQYAIPYASNQYYLIYSIFSKPEKRWEYDELLEKFGEENNVNGWRKVYDAMLTINKKVSIKLVEYSEKTYRLNPVLLSIYQA